MMGNFSHCSRQIPQCAPPGSAGDLCGPEGRPHDLALVPREGAECSAEVLGPLPALLVSPGSPLHAGPAGLEVLHVDDLPGVPVRPGRGPHRLAPPDELLPGAVAVISEDSPLELQQLHVVPGLPQLPLSLPSLGRDSVQFRLYSG